MLPIFLAFLLTASVWSADIDHSRPVDACDTPSVLARQGNGEAVKMGPFTFLRGRHADTLCVYENRILPLAGRIGATGIFRTDLLVHWTRGKVSGEDRYSVAALQALPEHARGKPWLRKNKDASLMATTTEVFLEDLPGPLDETMRKVFAEVVPQYPFSRPSIQKKALEALARDLEADGPYPPIGARVILRMSQTPEMLAAGQSPLTYDCPKHKKGHTLWTVAEFKGWQDEKPQPSPTK